MKFPDCAATLISFALKAGDPYSAAAVYALAAGENKVELERIMFAKRRDALALARWEHTPASVLDVLSKASDSAIVLRLDKNKNTASETLTKLYGDKRGVNKSSAALTVLIAQHRHASLNVLMHIAQFENDITSLLAVSKNATASAEVLSTLLDRFESSTKLKVLQKNLSENPSSSAVLLERLFDEGDDYVKAAVVGHANCSQQLIDKAARYENVIILRQLAADRRLTKDTIVKLSHHHDKSVRCAIASNVSTPQAIIKVLVKDDNHHTVRRAIASRPDLTMACIFLLMQDKDDWVRQRLARNSIVQIIVLDRLSKDAQVDVRRGVARNPRCSIKLLNVFAKDENYWVRSAVAYHPKAPKKLLELLANDSAVDVLSGVANNANTPQRLLKKLTDSSELDIRRGVILNKKATRSALLPLLEDPYYLHRLMLIGKKKLKDKDKWSLHADPDFQVRFMVFRYFADQFIHGSN
jgi:hypothetical protein